MLRNLAPLRLRLLLTRSASASSKPPKPLHPEEYLKVAREWPHEYSDPHNYAPLGTPVELPTDAHGHTAVPILGEHHKEDFSSPFYLKVIGLILAGVGIHTIVDSYTTTETVTSNGVEYTLKSHPITSYFEARMTSLEDQLRENEISMNEQLRQADARRIGQHAYERVYRIKAIDALKDRYSDHLNEPGTNVDWSDAKIKYEWAQDDKIMGKPYPKN